MRKYITAFLALFLLYGCSTFNNRKDEYSSLKMRIRTLESQVQTNSVNIKNNTLRLNSVEMKLLEIKKRLAKEREKDSFANKIPPISAIIGNDNSTSKIKKVGDKSVNNHKPKKIIVKNKKETVVAFASKKNDNFNNLNSNDDPVKKTKYKNYKTFHKKALNAYMKRNYLSAKNMFKAFIDEYSSNDLTDNAIFWLAHCYLNLGDKKKAISELRILIKKYPYGSSVTGGKTDAALYDLINLYSYDKKMSDYFRDILFKRFPMSKYTKIVKRAQGG